MFFLSTIGFKRVFTRCFKRGLYELFLQEYHRQTGNGLDERFDGVFQIGARHKWFWA